MKKTYGSETVKRGRKENTSVQEQTAKQQENHLTERTYADVVGTK